MRSLSASRRSGFTLVEMLVVIAIIVVLAAIIFPTFNRAREGGRQAKCTSQLIDIYQAMKMYREDYRAYPLPPDPTNGYWSGGVSALFPDDITSPSTFLCPNDARLRGSGAYQAPAQGGVLASSYNGVHADPLSFVPPPGLNASLGYYNYFGYSRQNLDPSTGVAAVIEGWLPTMMSFQEWDMLDGNQDGVGPKDKRFPSLVNRNTPPNTIITLCPWHREHFGNTPDSERFLVLRLDGNVDKMSWTNYDWIRQPGL